MTDHTEFESHLDAHPDDWEYRLVYADWLEEQGDPFCETQRWQVANKRRPLLFLDGEWTWAAGKSINSDAPSFLPSSLLRLMPEGSVYCQTNPTRHAAELDLHNALVKAGVISCALID